jgi:hypothetical protein
MENTNKYVTRMSMVTTYIERHNWDQKGIITSQGKHRGIRGGIMGIGGIGGIGGSN